MIRQFSDMFARINRGARRRRSSALFGGGQVLRLVMVDPDGCAQYWHRHRCASLRASSVKNIRTVLRRGKGADRHQRACSRSSRPGRCRCASSMRLRLRSIRPTSNGLPVTSIISAGESTVHRGDASAGNDGAVRRTLYGVTMQKHGRFADAEGTSCTDAMEIVHKETKRGAAGMGILRIRLKDKFSGEGRRAIAI